MELPVLLAPNTEVAASVEPKLNYQFFRAEAAAERPVPADRNTGAMASA